MPTYSDTQLGWILMLTGIVITVGALFSLTISTGWDLDEERIRETFRWRNPDAPKVRMALVHFGIYLAVFGFAYPILVWLFS